MVSLRANRNITILLDDEDLERVKHLKLNLTGQSRGVVSIQENGSSRSLARFLIDYDGPLEVDHKDHNKFNFQKDNLRPATRSQQMANSKPQLNRRFKGVHQHENGKFRTLIKINGKNIHGGYHKTEEKAAKRYDVLAKRYFGEFALLNFPENEVKR